MTTLPLIERNAHLFVELEDGLWLHDTGGPFSFGSTPSLRILDQVFEIPEDYVGLGAGSLSDLVGVPCRGLLGADVLGAFDQLIDVPGSRLTLATDELYHPGQPLEIDEFMGIPIVSATVNGQSFRLFFDTGAQVSYLQDEIIQTFPSAGTMQDFFPGFGRFDTDIHLVSLSFGGEIHTLQCGQLPSLLGMSLIMADVQGILGHAFLQTKVIGYFPRRGLLSL